MSALLCRLPPERLQRLTKLLGLLSSDHAGERANAGAMADRLIRENNLTWADVVGGTVEREPPPAYNPWEPPAPPWRKMAARILAAGHLNSWERTFVEGLVERWDGDLTAKQQKIFDRLIRAYTARGP